VPLDVSSEESCKIATRSVIERFGRLDILVNNAGTTVRKLPQDLSELEYTDLTQSARQQIGGLHDAVVNRTPAKRWGLPEDMAGPAVFLASDASNFVTGACLAVDGGYSARG
jgi:NAD(P)-dependent dehydrogenase (short-subunit alcohol dehydrogenase family)